MKLERIGEWVKFRDGWFKPLKITFENWTGKAEGSYQVRISGIECSTLEYFKTESEALAFAREIMGASCDEAIMDPANCGVTTAQLNGSGD
jgi:hypothetical protein